VVVVVWIKFIYKENEEIFPIFAQVLLLPFLKKDGRGRWCGGGGGGKVRSSLILINDFRHLSSPFTQLPPPSPPPLPPPNNANHPEDNND